MKIIVAEHSGLCYGVRRALTTARRTRRARAGRVTTLGRPHPQPPRRGRPRGRGHRLRRDARGGAGRDGRHPQPRRLARGHPPPPPPQDRRRRRHLPHRPEHPAAGRGAWPAGARRSSSSATASTRKRAASSATAAAGASSSRTRPRPAGCPVRKIRAVLAQSTQGLEAFERVVAALVGRTRELPVHNTICDSTQTRQKATVRARRRGSTRCSSSAAGGARTPPASTRSPSASCPGRYFIESAGQITPAMLRGARTIGVSGGAPPRPRPSKKPSTPSSGASNRHPPGSERAMTEINQTPGPRRQRCRRRTTSTCWTTTSSAPRKSPWARSSRAG